jgi:hypothetical protein
VETGGAQVLVVAKLDRLSRSLIDFAGVMERSRKRGWHVVALDLGVDTSSPSGEMIANVMATFAQFERRLIGARTREALAVRRSQGVRLGRPPTVPSVVVEQVLGLRAQGLSYAAIGRELDAVGVPTARGGKRWHPNTVRQVLASQTATSLVRAEQLPHPSSYGLDAGELVTPTSSRDVRRALDSTPREYPAGGSGALQPGASYRSVSFW